MRPSFLILPGIFCILAASASAQTSMFETADGQSSLYMRQATVAVNLGDSKASYSYYYRVNNKHPAVGFEAFATANKGVTSLFDSQKAKAPECGGDFTLSYHYLGFKMPHPGETQKGEDWLLLDAGYGRSSFYLYPTGVTPSANTAKTDFDRVRGILAYNRFVGGRLFLGLAAGAERRNNLSDLTSSNLQTILAGGSAGSSLSIVKTQAGYYGNYKQYVAAPIYADILYYPTKFTIPSLGDNKFAIDLFARSDAAATNRSASGGLGFFLFKKSDALTPIGGFTASFDGTKVQLGLTTGFSFQ
jgi:hypothetical protein